MVNKTAIIAELKRRQAEKAKPQFSFDEHCFPAQREFFRGPGVRFRSAVCSRRAGKCLKEGTLVKTPTGSVPIEELSPGDEVYGYDNDGVVRICQVTQLHDQGVKEVVDLIHQNKIIATSTLDHRWLAYNNKNHKRTVKSLKDFNTRNSIAEEYIKISGGIKHVEQAYALGALLGDGCSRESGINISTADEEVVQKVKKCLGAITAQKNHKNNYTWRLKFFEKANGRKTKIEYYDEWCRGKYAHEKIFDLEEVRSWTRESQLEFLAGLIDTDGCVHDSGTRVVIQIGMQARKVIENCQKLVLDLFQCDATIQVDDRKKYKNGPVYTLRISGNKNTIRILKELPSALPRKQWKDKYSNYTLNCKSNHHVGFKKSQPYKAQCYDITINNDSHLFLLANGLVTHNTVGIAADAIDTCLKEPDSLCLYITLTQQSARNIIWADITRILEKFEVNCKVDNTRLTLKFPNGSRFMLAGAKDRQEIEKYRGLKLKKCYIDECQSFRPYIEDLVNDIITPALRDLKGYLYLTGTPGPIPAGYFYTASNSDFWNNHHWTAFDNPHMHNPPELDLHETLAEERTMKGIDESNASYQRETYGLWVEDVDSLVYKFNKSVNIVDKLPPSDELTYIFGIDIGYNDADAIAVLGYHSKEKHVYLVEENVVRKQNITELVNSIKRLQSKYDPVKMVIDAGALGKKIQEEIIQRHGINLEAAEKIRKIEFIELLNDDLRTGKLKTLPGTVFEEDCMLLQWDRESKIRNPEKPKVSDVYHSDITDAVLYGWRACLHFAAIPDPTKLRVGSDAYMDEMERKEAEDMKFRQENPDDWDMIEGFEADLEDSDFEW